MKIASYTNIIHQNIIPFAFVYVVSKAVSPYSVVVSAFKQAAASSGIIGTNHLHGVHF